MENVASTFNSYDFISIRQVPKVSNNERQRHQGYQRDWPSRLSKSAQIIKKSLGLPLVIN